MPREIVQHAVFWRFPGPRPNTGRCNIGHRVGVCSKGAGAGHVADPLRECRQTYATTLLRNVKRILRRDDGGILACRGEGPETPLSQRLGETRRPRQGRPALRRATLTVVSIMSSSLSMAWQRVAKTGARDKGPREQRLANCGWASRAMTSSTFSNLARSTSAARNVGAISSGSRHAAGRAAWERDKAQRLHFRMAAAKQRAYQLHRVFADGLEVPPPASPNRNPQAAPVLIRIARPTSPRRTRPWTRKAALSAPSGTTWAFRPDRPDRSSPFARRKND